MIYILCLIIKPIKIIFNVVAYKDWLTHFLSSIRFIFVLPFHC